ncbi:hypothetical protein [Calothrix sp. NIES-2098]|uniref:hypothetical protein n=1 Tax=Calothrix sp. NIES-2098 TaxID=1954171 RepID=UPI000B5E76EE|nr:hypothetical protein NIES2098_30530 [Calothrix sp. NIES-2098]
MTAALRILEEITTDYTIFEKDQVLTESQLNSVADYLNDQTRLTRIYLIGVGVISGLRVSIENDAAVKITKGIGVTTDGDLLFYNNDTICDRYREYDNSSPKYAPFYVGGNTEGQMIPVYELISQGTTDSRSGIYLLSEFATRTNKNLRDMVAVLLMESYVNDPDICTGTDCDNLGQKCINTPRLLLLEKTSINSFLKKAIATPDGAVNSFNEGILNEVIAERPLIGSSINSVSALATIYRTACSNIHEDLVRELSKIYTKCATFIKDVFSTDPTDTWRTLLNRIKDSFANTNLGIQYYYDFLKDVVETYNPSRDLLLGELTWCCPDLNSFPKHLLLGNLIVDSGSNPEENRTPFYPSPAISQTAESLNHAKFLLRKLDTLIQNFQLPVVSDTPIPIRITPSLFEDQPLEERAIPYYYPVDFTKDYPIHKSWNYSLSKRRMEIRNYSYNAPIYAAQTVAAEPLRSQIGKFSFFRIEGHLGKNVQAAISEIEQEIKKYNLPITVRSVMLGTNKKQLIKPPIRYSELHRLHYLLRQDVANQLQEVITFSQNFKQKVDSAVKNRVITDSPETEGVNFQNIARDKNSTVARNAGYAHSVLRMNYSQYQENPTWKTNLTQAMQAASEFKYNLGNVVKTEFNTPFDTLVSNTQIHWIDLLDQIIKAKDEKENDRLLFKNFINQHPGIEHFGGVVRGGTFILVYDDINKTVVADFMLPYYCPDTVEEEVPEPTLTKPVIKPKWVIQNGVQVLPSIDRKLDKFKLEKLGDFIKIGQLGDFVKTTQLSDLVKVQLDNFKFEQLDKIQGRMQNQFENSVNLIGQVIGKIDRKQLETVGATKSAMELLDILVSETKIKRQAADILKEQARRNDLPPEERRKFEVQAKEAELALVDSIQETTKYISDSGFDVSKGSAGFRAMEEVASSIGSLTDNEAFTKAINQVGEVKDKTNNANLKLNILKLQIENRRTTLR